MKKILAIFAATSLLIGLSMPASAASTKSLKVGNLITVTYPSSVKLKKSGCQLIPFSYRVGNMGGLDFGFVYILDDEDTPIGGDILYRTPEFAKYEGEKTSKKSGKVNIKICRSAWVDGDEEKVGATKGEFQVYVTTSKQDNVGYVKFN
ncbi:MAG: hypothetical protein F2660_02820 [Actinobacteria bacterium]|uniref:Unannotated protein n=1 Tax=freshwater metagenome TaxID=449393 RepID=A0A6J6NJ64_9ZZZZ|nr:hypothetical protein [Actinomycetota bacterium]